MCTECSYLTRGIASQGVKGAIRVAVGEAVGCFKNEKAISGEGSGHAVSDTRGVGVVLVLFCWMVLLLFMMLVLLLGPLGCVRFEGLSCSGFVSYWWLFWNAQTLFEIPAALPDGRPNAIERFDASWR